MSKWAWPINYWAPQYLSTKNKKKIKKKTHTHTHTQLHLSARSFVLLISTSKSIAVLGERSNEDLSFPHFLLIEKKENDCMNNRVVNV